MHVLRLILVAGCPLGIAAWQQDYIYARDAAIFEDSGYDDYHPHDSRSIDTTSEDDPDLELLVRDSDDDDDHEFWVRDGFLDGEELPQQHRRNPLFGGNKKTTTTGLEDTALLRRMRDDHRRLLGQYNRLERTRMTPGHNVDQLDSDISLSWGSISNMYLKIRDWACDKRSSTPEFQEPCAQWKDLNSKMERLWHASITTGLPNSFGKPK